MIALMLLAGFLAAQTSMTPMRTIDRGTQSNVDDMTTVVARTAEEWAKIWRRHSPNRPAPAVDFSKEMVIGVFLGSRPTSGYGVEIVGTRDEGGAQVVEYKTSAPPRDMMTAQVLTMPYHIVAVPTRAGELRFEKRP